MKKIFILFVITAGLFSSCKNWDWDFPYDGATTGYFPYQYPVRTIVLGNYIYPNENDNNHMFIISAAVGGGYKNKNNVTFNFRIDESLCNNAFFSANNNIKILPSDYYRLSDNKIVVSKGKENGGVEVHLNDAFFNDPLAIRNTYVVPLRITGVTGVDSLLQGNPSVGNANPDCRIAGEWITTPKDFTMFAVKFINPYHGQYLHYGTCTVKNAAGNTEEEVTYRANNVEQNEVWKLSTSSRTEVTLTAGTFKSRSTFSGAFQLHLNFTTDDYLAQGGVNCTIEAVTGSPYTITGTGRYAVNSEEFGQKERDAIYLNYTISDGVNTYTANDVLVFRDKGVVMETYNPLIIY